MLYSLKNLRYVLELISVPVFAFLAAHLSAEGFVHLFGLPHESELIVGAICLILFVYLWHTPWLKKLVPCNHSSCTHKTHWPHLAASFALVFHFFPESKIRHELIQNFEVSSFLDYLVSIGFITHFLVDLIIIISLSQFWKKTWQKWTSFLVMGGGWIASFLLNHQNHFLLEIGEQPLFLILSAFLLSMFIHKPHKA